MRRKEGLTRGPSMAIRITARTEDGHWPERWAKNWQVLVLPRGSVLGHGENLLSGNSLEVSG